MRLYLFTKSGSIVRKVQRHSDGVTVERVDTGKRMLVPACGLLPIRKSKRSETGWETADCQAVEVVVPAVLRSKS